MIYGIDRNDFTASICSIANSSKDAMDFACGYLVDFDCSKIDWFVPAIYAGF